MQSKLLSIFLSAFLLMYLTINAEAQSSFELFKEGKEYRTKGKKNKAIRSFEDALSKAESSKNVDLQMKCHIELAELKDNVINYKEALDHYKSFTALYKRQMSSKHEDLEDSVNALETEVDKSLEEIEAKETQLTHKENAIDSLTTEQLQSELNIKDLEIANSQKENEIQAAENRRNILAGIIGIVILVLIFFSLGYARKRKTNMTLRNKNYQIAKEQEKSEELLLNILPKVVAGELKEFGKTTSNRFEETTVMFTDFVGFTKFSEKQTPTEIVKIIDGYFRAFDEITDKYDIEKIKTIGDAYMCVAGIPEHKEDHAVVMIKAAEEMRAFVQSEMEKFKAEGLPFLEMRIGLHSGPLVAGVVGSKKFAYDVWGDSVNVAARMEQAGKPGEINVSENTYLLAKEHFNFEFRGEVEAKNKGKMKMYFVV